MKKYTLSIFFAFCSVFTFAQNNNQIKGSLQNAKQEILAYATIELIDAKTKEFVTDLTSDEKGNFNFEGVEDGNYVIKILEFGYMQYEQPVQVSGGVADLGTIQLTPNKEDETIALKGVFIRKETSQYRNEIDKRVVEVGNDLVSSGTDAASVLNNIPSVNVDQQTGNLSLRGNENVKVYVDGKPSSQTAAQLLKQIPSNQIQRVEIITNPSAKYEADGKSGIINIILVKGQKKGYNVGLTTGYEQGTHARFNSSINSNINVGNFNFFGNVNYRDNVSKQYGIGQNYTDKIDQLFDIKNKSKNLSYKVGFDWFINDKNALTVYTNQWDGDGNPKIISTVLQNNLAQANINDIRFDYRSSDYSLNYKTEFEKPEHNIVLDAFYSNTKEKDDRDYLDTYPLNKFYQEFRNEKNSNTRINLDYTNQITDNKKLELGVQFRQESNKNTLNSTDLITDYNNVTYYPNVDFKFTRDFYSAYTNYNQKFGKFGAQIGLRLEHVKDNANWFYEPNKLGDLKRNNTDLFPSAFLTYDISEKGKVSFNYSRRIDRPNFYQLTPVPQFTTPLMSSEGNPNLRPEYTNSIELGYLQQLEKGSISGNLFYRHVKDNMIQAFIKNPEVPSAFIQYTTNYDKTNSYGAEASFNYKVAKWFNAYLAADFTSSEMQSENKKITANILSARLNNTYTISKSISLQQFAFYRGKTKFLQGEMLDMWRMDLGLKYTFMQGKASFTARVNDIFKTMRARVNMDNPYNGYANFNWESRTFYLGFNYNFGGKVRSRTEAQQNKTEQTGGGIGL